MSKTSKLQRKPSALARHDLRKSQNPPPSPASKLSDRYIFVSDNLFPSISHLLNYVDWIVVRNGEEFNYRQAKEDIYAEEGANFYAQVYRSKEHFDDLLLYVEHQGRLYSCKDILEAAALIEEIKALEALKIISKEAKTARF